MDDNAPDIGRLLGDCLETLNALPADDRDAIAQAGGLLEAVADDLPGDTPKVGSLLNLGLELLERAYLGEAEDLAAELAALRDAIGCAAEWVEHGCTPDLSAAVDEAGNALWKLLGKDAAVSPFLLADGDEDTAAPACDLTADDVAAVLIGLSPNDTDDLRPLEQALARLAQSADWPVTAREQAQRAADALGEVIEGVTGDADAWFDLAIEAVGAIPPLLAPDSAGDEPAGPGPEAQPELPPQDDGTSENSTVASEPDELVTLEFDGDLDMLREFVTESLEHIEGIEGGLLDLEANPEDTEAVNAVFRGFHTIKGAAGFLGLGQIQQLAHRAESLLDRVRNGEISLAGGYADLALESADTLRSMLADLQELQEGEELPAPPEALSDLLARLSDPEGAGITSEAADLPPPPARTGDILVAEGKAYRQAVEEAAASQDAPHIGEKIVRSGAADLVDVGQTLRRQRQVRDSSAEATVRVRTDRLDSLINMVGELVIANAMLSHDEVVQAHHAQALGSKVDHINKTTRELQSVGMSLRMVPFRATFQKMARAVRDLARKADKQVNFVTEGEDTEIDRNMVESLADPLLHMVRNAVDHGIEPPAEREVARKPAAGTIILRAYHDAGNVVIELQDDGKGLDREKLLEKAVARGVVEAGKQLTDEEVFKLIFHAGLSTAESVTDVSGRGVGMDVVRRNIEAVRGRVDITSARGKGSTFAIRIPLTLAIIDGMLLRVGNERYVLPTVAIQEAFRADQQALSTVTGRGEMVLFRGDLIPVLRLHWLFGVRGATENITDAVLMVAEHDGELCALVADELLGQQQIVIKSLGQGLGDVAAVSGAAILGDGRVGLILDIGGILALARGQDGSRQHLPARRAA